ncbi:MAG: RND transporter [Gammaproteobacteria bacterium]|nr:RND transporter [Gammaproteobacteria bacterium]
MYSLRFRLARWVIAHRAVAAAIFVLLTGFFAAGLRHVELRTVFSDLLPEDDPFVQVYKDHPNFGNPLTVTIVIRRLDGDIYNADTIAKVWQLTRDIDLTPGVDHDQILSIATEKARYVEATASGIDMRPLMDDYAPKSAAEIDEFRRRVERSPNVRRFLISEDHAATLINATFIEPLIDYGTVFAQVGALAEAARDAHHQVHVAGRPILTGWVYQHEREMFYIFALTLSALLVALVLYMRNVVGVVTPVVASGVAAVWGFGFAGWMHSAIEPLLLVVPLLLVARSLSHCVQFTERFYEVFAHVRDRRIAAEITMGVMMAPSVLGIFTDMAAIFLIAVAPIPAMERFALFCGFWTVWLIPTGVVLVSLLLCSLPAPRNVEKLIGRDARGGFHRRLQELLRRVATLTCGRPARVTGIVVGIVAVTAIYLTLQIRIGNPVEGSNLLWPDSPFNEAVREVNRSFPGVDTLEVVLEAQAPENLERVATQAESIRTMLALQRLIENGPLPPRATLSFADYIMEANRLFAGGNPKWLPVDDDDRATKAAAMAVMMGSSPKAFSHVVDFEQEHATVSLWYPDNRQETVDAALAAARAAVRAVGTDHPAFTVRLATGTIALQEAMNNVVARYSVLIIVLLNLVILVGCSLAYRSIVAGLILLVPVNLANFVLDATMYVLGIGLDINSLLVAAIGVGVGIDYGIYLLSRICEEYQAHDQSWERAIAAALGTTGRAVLFTASIMLIGILPWYFLSGLKFMADMGLLLVVIMLINMLLALVVLPLLLWFLQPSFVGRRDLFIGEGIDPALFVTDDSAPRSEPA